MDPKPPLVDMYGKPISEEDREILERILGRTRTKSWLWRLALTEEEKKEDLLRPSRGSGSRPKPRVPPSDSIRPSITHLPDLPPVRSITDLRISQPLAEAPLTASIRGPTPCEECTHKFIELSRYGLDLEADKVLSGCRCNREPPNVSISSSKPFLPTFLEGRHEHPVISGTSHISDLALFFALYLGI